MQESVVVIRRALNFADCEKPLSRDFRRRDWHRIQQPPGISALTRAQHGVRQSQLDGRLVRRRGFIQQSAIIVGRLRVALRAHEAVGTVLTFSESWRDNPRRCGELLQFDLCGRGFKAERNGEIKMSQNCGSFDFISRSLIGTTESEFQVGSCRNAIILEQCDCFLRTIVGE